MPEYESSINQLAQTNPIGARLKLEMKKQGLNSSELARRADLLTSFLYDIIRGKSSNPSTIKLARVADALGISLSYLVRGEEETPSHQDSQASGNEYLYVPWLEISGNGNTARAEAEPYSFQKEWIASHFDSDMEDLRVLDIDGDSMEPTLLNHDIVLVDTGRKVPSPAGIFILFDGLGFVAKRLEYVSELKTPHIRGISDNQHYSTYECSLSEATIMGRVVWFSREI